MFKGSDKTISFDEMTDVSGDDSDDCALTTIGNILTLSGFAYAMVFECPFAWGTAIVGSVVTVGTIICNSSVCDNIRG